jgi:hypothetical protein
VDFRLPVLVPDSLHYPLNYRATMGEVFKILSSREFTG